MLSQAFLIDRQRQDGRGGGAVAGDVAGLLGDRVHELGAHVLEGIGQVDFLGDGDAVLGDGRAAEGFVDDDVAPVGPIVTATVLASLSIPANNSAGRRRRTSIAWPSW